MHKRGIELSVNFLVILIISIVIFSGAVALTYKIFGKVREQEAQLGDVQKQELTRILAGGSKVAIPFNSINIYVGKTGSIPVGILNTLGYSSRFQVSAYVKDAYKPDNKPITQPANYIRLVYVRERTIANNEQYFLPVAVAVDKKAPAGTYTINVEVKYLDKSNQLKPYDTLRKIYVQVS